jgi:hypothetical protein
MGNVFQLIDKVLHVIWGFQQIKTIPRVNRIMTSVFRMGKMFQVIYTVLHIISNSPSIKSDNRSLLSFCDPSDLPLFICYIERRRSDPIENRDVQSANHARNSSQEWQYCLISEWFTAASDNYMGSDQCVYKWELFHLSSVNRIYPGIFLLLR